MKFSIVIPTFNRLDQLRLVLNSLGQQRYLFDQFEVLVISDGSTDGTEQYLYDTRTPFHLRPILQENKGVANARNAGILAAQGEIIVFIDDDTVPEPNFLQEHARIHRDHGLKTIALGPMLAPRDYPMEPWVSWEQSRLLEQYKDMGNGRWSPTARQFYTANASLARKHLIDEGGFDPEFRRAEDVELAYRLEKRGLRFVYSPDAIVYHYAKRSFETWIAIPYHYGINDVIFAKEKDQSWLLPTVFREYHNRHNLVRILTRVCLDRTLPTSFALFALKNLILLSDKIGLREAAHLICGGVFNLRYYQGVSDQLGGRECFFSSVRAASHSLTQESA